MLLSQLIHQSFQLFLLLTISAATLRTFSALLRCENIKQADLLHYLISRNQLTYANGNCSDRCANRPVRPNQLHGILLDFQLEIGMVAEFGLP